MCDAPGRPGKTIGSFGARWSKSHATRSTPDAALDVALTARTALPSTMAAKSGSNVDLYLGMRVTSPARDPRADREFRSAGPCFAPSRRAGTAMLTVGGCHTERQEGPANVSQHARKHHDYLQFTEP